MQDINFIPEGDVYRLIIKSKLPVAERFESWVMDEVLPQIRQTGGYIPIAQEDDEATLMAKALIIAQKTIDKKNELIAIQQKELIEQKPLVEFARHVTESSDAIDIGELAKVLHKENIDIGRNRLFQWLRDKGILMNTNIPYQKYINSNYFQLVEVAKNTNYNNKIFIKVLVTGRGQVYIINKFKKEYYNLSK